MDIEQFDRSVGDLAATLGDATRRGIYVTVRASETPMTANEIADVFAIHPNVARHHLDRLAGDGYLQVTRKRRSGKRGPGAGRPAKCYEPTGKEITIQFPPRRPELLAELLAEVVERVAPERAGDVAEQVGREYGHKIARELDLPQGAQYARAVRVVAEAMTGLGFDARAEPDDHRMVTCHCPFGETAGAHPAVVCRLDKGIVTGMLEATCDGAVPVTLTPRHTAGGICITDL